MIALHGIAISNPSLRSGLGTLATCHGGASILTAAERQR